jgi:hypothetical protein
VGVTADDPSNDTDPTPASYVNITGNYLYGSDRDGPSIYDGNHVTVNNNYVGNTAPYAVIFDTEPVATRWQNDYISFTNNTIGLHDNTWVSGAGASAVNNNIVVENNVVLTNKGTDSSGMAFGQGLSTNPSLSTITNPAIRQNLTIENNSGGSSSPNTERGSITVSGFNNVVISGNSMNVDTKSVAGSAFALNIVTNTTISNNDIIQSGSNPFTLFNIVDNKSSLVAANNTFCNNKVNGVIADGSCSNPTTPHQTTPTPSTGQSGSQATSGNTKNSPGGTSGHIQSTGAPTPSSSAASTKSESSAQQEQAEQSSVPIPLIHTRVSREYVAASAYSFIMMGSLGISFAVIHRKLFWI